MPSKNGLTTFFLSLAAAAVLAILFSSVIGNAAEVGKGDCAARDFFLRGVAINLEREDCVKVMQGELLAYLNEEPSVFKGSILLQQEECRPQEQHVSEHAKKACAHPLDNF